MSELPRVFFDSNDGDFADGEWVAYWLGHESSKRDLAAIGPLLKDGLRIILYMEDMEVQAVLEFDRARDVWLGRPIWETQRDLPGDSS